MGGGELFPPTADHLRVLPLPVRQRKLRITFASEAAFRGEYRANVANGGIFVATNVDLDLRESVCVEIGLDYCGARIELEGEIVHVVTPEVASGGGTPGVAVQFSDQVAVIRSRFADYLIGPDEDASNATERRARRTVAEIAGLIHLADGDQRRVRTRDLSHSGVLLAIEGEVPAIGENLLLRLFHPYRGQEIDVSGTVVRYADDGNGTVSAFGLRFDGDPTSDRRITDFVDEAGARGHPKRLSGITGRISELGIQNLIQMFGAWSPRGTLMVFRGHSVGFVIFEKGMLRSVRLDQASGRQALVGMLQWVDGTFDFRAAADTADLDKDGVQLDAAILDAMRVIDESQRQDYATFPPHARVSLSRDDIDAEASTLSTAEAAIIDLAGAGMTVSQIVDIIPEAEIEIQLLMTGLIGRGLITVDA
jgi:Tfp pilus assembly protein PilZ